MPDSLLAAARVFRAALAGFEPGLCPGEDCAAVVDELAATEKACSAALARAAARASDCGVHRHKGFADAADWLARASGTSMGAAKAELDTVRALRDLPETRAAVTAGELSLAQAAEVARTEAECPGSETELLQIAKGGSLKTLRDKAKKRRLGTVDAEELHARQHKARFFRHWSTDLGMVGFAGELPPEVGLPFVNRLDAETDRLRRQARRDGNREAWEAYGADALVKLAAGAGQGKARSADLVIVCDLRAFRRGHAHLGEPCHLVGGGPVSVALVKELSEDAFLKAVLHDGTRIDTVVHFGRHPKAELRTALELGAVPDFDGVSCVEVGCDRRYHLEWDHVDPRANHGPTSYDNLKARCYPHHREKTARDRQAGLLRGNRREPDPP
jgi:hypothetical protein